MSIKNGLETLGTATNEWVTQLISLQATNLFIIEARRKEPTGEEGNIVIDDIELTSVRSKCASEFRIFTFPFRCGFEDNEPLRCGFEANEAYTIVTRSEQPDVSGTGPSNELKDRLGNLSPN